MGLECLLTCFLLLLPFLHINPTLDFRLFLHRYVDDVVFVILAGPRDRRIIFFFATFAIFCSNNS
jgi:hypothetical protein